MDRAQIRNAIGTSVGYGQTVGAAVYFFVMCYIVLGIRRFPYLVPPSITIWTAAAPDASLGFLLVGALVLVPVILAYTAFSYWVFRGKITSDPGYH